jgi:phage tail sheath gpL-like
MGKVGRNDFVVFTEGHAPANTGGIVDLAPDFKVEKSELISAILVAPAVGVPASVAITIGGSYVVGDEITVSLQSNAVSRQKWTKAYKHTVQAGATSNNDIAAAINARIEADGLNDAPYTSGVAGAVITVTAKDDDSQSLAFTVYTNSSAGTIAGVLTPATISEGQPQDLIDKGVDAAKINLAQYDTVKIDYEADAPIGSIDAVTGNGREIYWYGTPGNGAALVTLINTP